MDDTKRIIFSNDMDIYPDPHIKKLPRFNSYDYTQSEFNSNYKNLSHNYEAENYEDFIKKVSPEFDYSYIKPYFESFKYSMLTLLYKIYSTNPDCNATSTSESALDINCDTRDLNLEYHKNLLDSKNNWLIFRFYSSILLPHLTNEKSSRSTLHEQLECLKIFYNSNEKPGLFHTTDLSSSEFNNFQELAENTNLNYASTPYMVSQFDQAGIDRINELKQINRQLSPKNDQNNERIIFSETSDFQQLSKHSQESVKENESDYIGSKKISESKPFQNPCMFYKPEKNTWVVKWVAENQKRQKIFNQNNHVNPKDAAYQFLESVNKAFIQEEHFEQKNDFIAPGVNHTRRVTRGITSSNISKIKPPSIKNLREKTKQKQTTNSPSASLKNEIISTDNVSQSLPDTSKSTESIPSSLQSEKSGNFKFKKLRPGRPPSRLNSPLKPGAHKQEKENFHFNHKITHANTRPPGRHYNVSKSSSNNQNKDASRDRLTRLRKAMKFPYYFGVQYESNSFAWVATMDNDTRQFLIKKYGWGKAHDFAVNQVFNWRKSLSSEKLQKIIDQENEIINHLIEAGNSHISQLNHYDISALLSPSNVASSNSSMDESRCNDSLPNTSELEKSYSTESFKSDMGKTYSTKGAIQNSFYVVPSPMDDDSQNSCKEMKQDENPASDHNEQPPNYDSEELSHDINTITKQEVYLPESTDYTLF